MSETVHADVFFFITSIAVILFAAAGLVCAYYIIHILRDLSDIVAKLKTASRGLEDDFESLRREVKNEGVKVRAIADIVLGFLMSRLNTVKKKATPRKPKAAVVAEEGAEIEEELQ